MTPSLRLILFLAWLGVILLCLFFGRRAAPIIQAQGGLVGILLLVAGAGAGLAWFALKFKRLPQAKRPQAALVCGVCVLGLLVLAWLQPLLIERTHIILYGVLGVLAWELTADKGLSPLRRMFYAGLLCVLVGTGDELIQHVHPERVGDPRDVLTNAASGVLAVVMSRGLHPGPS